MKCYVLILFLIGCNRQSEINARNWIWTVSPAVPIQSIVCEDIDEDSDGRVFCVVETESMGRIFKHKLKCYNSNTIIPHRSKCVEALDD